jgi:methylase of polypeptide subunit release factors
MQNKHIISINNALAKLSKTKSISSAILVCNTLLEYMGFNTKEIEDIELSELKLPNSDRYNCWFHQHPYFGSGRACFELLNKNDILEAKLYCIQKRSKLVIAGAVNFTPNYEDRDYTRHDPNMKVGIDFFLTPEKNSILVVLSNKGMLRLVELSQKLSNTQAFEIFALWNNITENKDRNIFHSTLWDSFKLSSLNKKFYEGIAERFTTLTQHLKDKGVEEQISNQFANRLLGRLLFLWFLRKKNIINETKGYFDIGEEDDTDYYHKTLSTLFFKVLNSEDHTKLDPVTPYLNGGLFDENADGEYWKKHKVTFPRGFFHGLYEHFNKFNFTTDESTPEYEQIAIDPEMLGRIFESFLATLKTETGAQAKKANGAFYTPREIVSYMSRESLRQYLYTSLEANESLKKSIDGLLDRSDSDWALAGTNSKRDVVSPKDSERILKALDNLKVLDPAVGSGAFPMGMLHQLLNVYERLNPEIKAYEYKSNILKKNIYGVDIDPTAVEISRLRAWLSLIVDVQDMKQIKPLPNLDFKFVCANSLIGLEGEELQEGINTSKKIKVQQTSLGVDNDLKSKLMQLRDKYYETSNANKKIKLQEEYIKLTHQANFFDSKRIEQLKSYKPFTDNEAAGFYDAELMHGIEAFDIVIGNPPYVGEKGNKSTFEPLKKSSLGKRFYLGKMDLFYFFFHLGLDLAKEKGIVAFITTNYYITATGAKKLINDFQTRSTILSLINFNEMKVFESALGQHNMITLIKKGRMNHKATTTKTKRKGYLFNSSEILKDILYCNDKHTDYHEILQDDIYENDNIKLSSHETNPIEGILSKISKNATPLKELCHINQGLKSNADYVMDKHLKKYPQKRFIKGEGIFILKTGEIESLNLNNNERKFIKPLFKNSDINYYVPALTTDSQIVYITKNNYLNAKQHPNLLNHFEKYMCILKDRSEVEPNGAVQVYALTRPRNKTMYEGEKIIAPYKTNKGNCFAYTNQPWYASGDVYFITNLKTKSYKLLLGILNSSLIFTWLSKRGKKKGEIFELYTEPLSKIPIPLLNNEKKQELAEKVESLINLILMKKESNPEANTQDLEAQINKLVYQLYDLTEEEIKIVENEIHKSASKDKELSLAS